MVLHTKVLAKRDQALNFGFTFHLSSGALAHFKMTFTGFKGERGKGEGGRGKVELEPNFDSTHNNISGANSKKRYRP